MTRRRKRMAKPQRREPARSYGRDVWPNQADFWRQVQERPVRKGVNKRELGPHAPIRWDRVA